MNQPVIERERIEYIDILRIISMIFVVFMHTAAGSLRSNIGSIVWHVSNVFTSIMCTSVPIFFMISGALLLSSKKTESIAYVYKKRFPKAFIPFALWSFVAIVYFVWMKYTFVGEFDIKIITGKLKNITSEATIVHLWFMYALIPIYILSPILKKLVDSMTPALARYALCIWLFFSSILPTTASFVPDRFRPLFKMNSTFSLNFMNGYLGYFILGYYLFKTKKRFSKKILLLIILADTIIIALGTWYKAEKLGLYLEYFLSYPRIFMLVLSVSVFLFVKELMRDKQLSGKTLIFVKFLSSLSFGVYLMHNMLVDYISNFINLWHAKTLYDLFLSFIIVLFSSFASIVILSSCKLTCFIFTGLSYKAACDSCNLRFIAGGIAKIIRNKLNGSKPKQKIQSIDK